MSRPTYEGVERAVTCAWVNALLTCYGLSHHDKQMIREAAAAAGMNPLSSVDRSVILADLGRDTLKRFVEILGDH